MEKLSTIPFQNETFHLNHMFQRFVLFFLTAQLFIRNYEFKCVKLLEAKKVAHEISIYFS